MKLPLKPYNWLCFCLVSLFCTWITLSESFGQGETHAAEECQCSVRGSVLDLQTKEPLPNASVWIEGIDKGNITNEEGNFEFNNLCVCRLHVRVSYLGYKTFETTINLRQDSVVTVYLADEEMLLDNIMIEGTATTSLLSTLAESSLSGQALERVQGRSLAESLEQLSGVSSLQTGASVGKPIVHGLHSNRILILNNGIRMEGQQWGAEHAPEIDPFIAKDIAVVKGAATVKYGTEALGGVVVVNPPDLYTGNGVAGEVNLAGMSNGGLGVGSAMIEGGIPAIDGLGWRVQSTVKRGGDVKAPDYYLTNTGVKEFNYSMALGYKKQAYGLEAFYSHFDTELGILKATGFIGSLHDLQQAFEAEPPLETSPGFSYDIGNPKQVVSHNLFKLNGFYQTALGKLDLQYGLQLNRRKEFDIRRGSLSDIPSMNLEIATHSLELELSHRPFGRWQGSLGANGMYQNNSNIFGTQRSNFIPNFNTYSGGVYLIERWRHDKWLLEAGARYDYKSYVISGWHVNEGNYDDAFQFQNVTASLGGSYYINDKSFFSTNLGSAWRPPHVAELFSFGKHQSNAGLEYGLLWQWDREASGRFFINKFDQQDIQNEKGLKWINTYTYAGDRWEADISAYINYIKNYIYIRPEGVTLSAQGALPYYWYRQTDASFMGIDLAMHYEILPYLHWHNKMALISARDVRNDDYLPYIPANRFETGLELERERWKGLHDLYLGLNVAYYARQRQAPRVIPIEAVFGAAQHDINLFAEDSRNFDFLPVPDAYVLVNLEAGFTKEYEHASLSARAGVKNLFNVDYRNYTNRLRYFADDIGRNFTVGVTYKFEQE